MLKFLPYAVQVLAILGGTAGGVWLKGAATGAEPPTQEAEDAATPSHETKAGKKSADGEKKKDRKTADKGHGEKGHSGGEHGAGDAGSSESFMKFSRQFVVPVVEKAGVRSLVVLDINIETPPDKAEAAYAKEPKLRDAALAALLRLSARGAFNDQFLRQDNLDAIRAELLESSRSIIGDDARNVLILSITRQDV